MLKELFKILSCYRNRCEVKRVFSEKRLGILKKNILNYYQNVPQDKMSDELLMAVDYLKHNPVTYFPCNLKGTYSADMIQLNLDCETQLNFALINGKRMFFKRGWTENECIQYCSCIQNEQNENSPHKYLSETFDVQTGDIVVDVGAAEGIFALEVIERARKVYLFEVDSAWIEALEATFVPWKEKVEIVNKCLSDKVSHKSVTLDSFFQNKQHPDFIKIDVDGVEAKIIRGGRQLLLDERPLRIALCTYHKQEDESEFSKLLGENGYSISFSKGYFLFLNDELSQPYFRRGVLRAIKNVPIMKQVGNVSYDNVVKA